jgi:quaternary ammonium compound-resistance protein SugE
MAWAYLLLAGLAEIGWPVGLKMGWTEGGIRWPWIGLALVCMGFSGALLLLAQRQIPMGTAYAVWTGIGAVGAFAVGVVAYGDPAAPLRIASAALIVAGVVGLKLFG